MKPTLKAVTELVEKEYDEVDAKIIHAMIVRDPGLGAILKKFPQLGYGIEYIEITHKSGRNDTIAYINTGDTYASTLIRDRNGKIIISTIGDVIESLPSTWSAK